MRGTIFTKSKMNYFGSFGQQRTWALLAQGAPARPKEERSRRHRFPLPFFICIWKLLADHCV